MLTCYRLCLAACWWVRAALISQILHCFPIGFWVLFKMPMLLVFWKLLKTKLFQTVFPIVDLVLTSFDPVCISLCYCVFIFEFLCWFFFYVSHHKLFYCLLNIFLCCCKQTYKSLQTWLPFTLQTCLMDRIYPTSAFYHGRNILGTY